MWGTARPHGGGEASIPTPARVPSGPTTPARRAPQERDEGRRGKGSLFGAFTPADGEALTAPSAGRTTANAVDCLAPVEGGIAPAVERIEAIMDHLRAHRATEVLWCSLAPPRWEFIFQPPYAPSVHLIEPWWQVLRSLALKGRRVERWAAVCQAVHEATQYWNAHRHPFLWGRRRRHQPRRRPGMGRLPTAV
jgi:DDE superfamily endonuclease